MSKILNKIMMIAFVAAVSLGCNKALKNPDDYYPITKITNATVQSDGTVLVEGTVVSPGKHNGAAMEYVGFCASATGEPLLTDNQIMGVLEGDKFYAVYPAAYFDENETYQIASWGTNGIGYTLSESLSFDSLFLDVTPPCSIANNYYHAASNTGYYSTALEVSTNEYWASDGNDRFSIEFDSPIHAGIYTTHNYAAAGKVQCSVDFGGWRILDNGANVYVEKTSATTYKVTICSSNFHVGASTASYSASITIQL